MLIEKPGVYHRISAAQYHTDNLLTVPTLSSSAAKTLVNESPMHCWANHPRFGGADFDREHKRHMEMGSALHKLVLGSDDVIERIDADSYRSKEAKEQRDAAAQDWRIPILSADYAEVEAAATAVRKQLAARGDPAFTDGAPETTLIWQEDGGVWCRARLDYSSRRRVFDDFKGTLGSAHPAQWSRRNLFNLGYDIQAAFYLRGIRKLGLHEDPIFRFVVTEMKAPYALSMVYCSEALVAQANEKVEMALSAWRYCLASGEWYGYGDHLADASPWQRTTEETDD
jgi:hypothetical protein